MSIGNTLNNVGRYTTMSQIITGLSIIIILVVVIGFLIYQQRSSTYIKTTATVVDVNCESYKEEQCSRTRSRDMRTCKNVTRYNCILNIVFVTNKNRTIQTEMRLKNQHFEIKPEQTIEIEYDKHNPFQVRKPAPLNLIIGILSALLCCITLSTISVSMLSGSRTYRQYHATSTGVSMISKLFRSRRN